MSEAEIGQYNTMGYDRERGMMNDTKRSIGVAAQSYNEIGAKARDITSVERQMSMLTDATSCVLETAERIEVLLAPVLRPATPDGNMREQGVVGGAPLADAIQMERMKVDRVFIILGDIIERLEI